MGYSIALGVDIDMTQLSNDLRAHAESLGSELFMTTVGCAMIDGAKNLSTLKLQSAFFEAQGVHGIRAMKNISEYAKKNRFSVILDAKRGDIESTMRAYGEFAFDSIGADSLTVLPYMGAESMLSALLSWLKTPAKKIYIVLVSSNQDGRAIQEFCYPRVFEAFINAAEKMNIDSARTGFVVGATRYHELSAEIKHQLKKFSLLLPGFGAQGATMNAELKNLISTGRDLVFPISRGLINFSKVELHGQALDVEIASIVQQNSLRFAKQFEQH